MSGITRLSEFDAPPADPIKLFREWFDDAVERLASEPGVLALATCDALGHASNRMVQVNKITIDGLVFASHHGSQKGRELAVTGWASGVLYWRETGRQIILTGPAGRLPDAESDALWAARPVSTHAMSTASEQSAPLDDETELRTKARRLAGEGALPRPPGFAGYHLTPAAIEFWYVGTDRLHQRLRYDRTDDGWTGIRLQP